MHRLEEMEYVLIHRGKRGQSFEYELLYCGEGEQSESFLMGLIDTTTLKKSMPSTSYDQKKEPLNTKKERLGSPQVAVKEPLSSIDEIAKNTEENSVKGNLSTKAMENALREILEEMES
jgi:DNA primase